MAKPSKEDTWEALRMPEVKTCLNCVHMDRNASHHYTHCHLRANNAETDCKYVDDIMGTLGDPIVSTVWKWDGVTK